MSEIPHVAMLIETSRTYTRNVLRGVKRYISLHGPWSVFLEMRALDSGVPAWLPNWRGDGILCRSANQRMADAVAATGTPAVELRASKLKHSFPFVGVDNRAMGQLVADHFLERGFRNFGCYELDTESFFEERRDNFVSTLAEHGLKVDCYRTKGRSEHPSQWERQQTELVDWVKQLRKPAAVMACTDQLGFWLLDACKRGGVAVPEELAVVGVEDDESLCEMASPPMSSVHFPGAKIGFAAAALLGKLMAGEPVPPGPLLFPPVGITARGSSDVVAIEDPLVSGALRFIRQRAREGIRVDDVAEAVSSSRSTLERRMRKLIGRSPQEEIARIKLDLVRQLLVETDLPLDAVAERSGFAYVQYMVEAFRNTFDMTPGQYRKKARLPEG